MELTTLISQRHIDIANLAGACEIPCQAGGRIDSLTFDSLSWCADLFSQSELDIPREVEVLGQIHLSLFGRSGDGYGDGAGAGAGYGAGYGSGDGDGDGYVS